MLAGTLRHRCVERILGRLHDRHAAAIFYAPQPGGAVIEHTAEDNPNDPRPAGGRGGAEQHVHRRAHPVLLGSTRNSHPIRLDHEVPIRGGDIDAARGDRFSIDAGPGAKRTGTVENLVQLAGSIHGNVQYHQNGGGKSGRQTGYQCFKGLNPSGGRSDDNDVALNHVSPSSKATQRDGTG